MTMASGQTNPSDKNMDLLSQIDNLQAYLQQMKEKLKKGGLSSADTQNALQKLNIAKAADKKLPEKRKKTGSPKPTKSATSTVDYGAAGDTTHYQTVEEVEKEMEIRVAKMRKILSASSKTAKDKKRESREQQYIKVMQMRRSKKFQCIKCSRTFVHLEKAEEHVKSEHLDEDDPTVTKVTEKEEKMPKVTENVEEIPKKKKSTGKGKEVHIEEKHEGKQKSKRKLKSDVEQSESMKEKRVKCDARTEVKEKTVKEEANEAESESYLTCKACGETFSEEYRLLEHETAKHWTCTSCQVQFLHEESWSKHQKECKNAQATRRRSRKPEITKNEGVLCPSLKPYKRGETFLHFVSVLLGSESMKKRMACTVCSAKYATLTQLKRHIQGMHTHEKEHICNDCGKGFVEESKLIYHVANTCSKTIPQNLQATDLEGDESMTEHVAEEEEAESLTLRLEDESPNEETTEPETTKGEDEGTEVVFNITFDKEAVQLDSSADETLEESLLEIETKMCTLCNMAFTYGYQRRQHMSACHWGCDACGVQFLHEHSFQLHVDECKVAVHGQKSEFAEIKLRHTYESEDDFFKYIVVKFKEVDKKKQAKMECLVCGKEYFGQLAKMMRHVKSVHTKECNYICHSCSKPFADKDNFGKHMKKCTGKPWVPKSNIPSSTVTMPIAIEAMEEDENTTWSCTQCMETFTEDYQFREHMSGMHWGCGTCWWQFLDDKAFQEHAASCEEFKGPVDAEMPMPDTDLIQYRNDRLFFQHVKMRVLKQVNAGKIRTFECGHPHCQDSEHDYQTLFQLRKHIQYRHETRELKYQCAKCGTGFVDKFSLWKHNNKCSESGEKIVISKLLSRIKPTNEDLNTKEDGVIVKKECPECEEGFLYDYNYREHMAMKHWGCKPCRLQFLSNVAFDEHKGKCERQHYGRALTFPKVNLKLYRNDQKFFDYVQINFANRSNRLYQCTQCGDKNHGNLVKLKRHITSKHTKEMTEKCVVCEKGFRDKRALLKHLSEHLKTGTAILDVPENELEVNLARIQEYVQKYSFTPVTGNHKAYIRTLTCDEGCDITFADSISHLTHMAEIHYKCQYCRMPFRSRSYQLTHESICAQNQNGVVEVSPEKQEEVPSVKPINHKKRESLDFMTEHGISYEDGRLNCYGCQRCDKTFKDIAKIKRHVLGHHLKVSEHVCKTCGKGFYEKKAMISHEKVHKNQSERGHITCDICGLKLLADVPNSLKNHMTKHTGERPFLCHLCPMAFRAKNTLQTHINGVHLMKKDYSCSQCTFSCTSKGRLRVHMRIHTGEKPYKCETCGEAFREKGPLRNHKMIHSGYRTVYCDICGQGFIKKVHYTSHMLNTHSLRVLDTDPKVQSFMPQMPVQIQRADTGTTYQIVSNVEDEVEVVTDNDIVEGAEYETVRIISGDQVSEHAYIVMINGEDDITYAYAQ